MPAAETAVFVSPTWSTTQPPATPSAWSPADSASLYRINAWGSPYFAVNPNGNVSVRPHGDYTLPYQEIDLLKVVQKSVGCLRLRLPLIVRFPDVLKHRLESLQSSFDLAIKFHGYKSHYQGVYPVKSNQDKHVVADFVKYGSSFRFGLEAGSKPELLLAMSSLCHGSPDSLLVCNGFKDEEYISLALIARKLKLNTVIVLEQEDELDFVIKVSKRLNLRPVIGIRAKLRAKHPGRFGSTSGKDGKFGLTSSQIVRIVNKLKQNGMLDTLQMLHFHIGAQIPTTSFLSDGVSEAAQIYCELIRLGASMGILDIGGGLGIDFDGSKSGSSDVSVSYTLQEYASAVVQSVRKVCDKRGLKHPMLCSESGRALVSHHSVLVFETFSTSCHDPPPLSSLQNFVTPLTDVAVAEFQELSDAALSNDSNKCMVYAEKMKEKYVKQFNEGLLPIEHLATIEGLHEAVSKVTGRSNPARTYNINLSIFTSMPDSWGIGQLFPIIPIHRLDEKPTVRGFLSDLTCDSDGKVDKFIGGESSLPLHELKGGESYYMGMFLGGAYQESLGGMHNLFGTASVVRVVQSDGPHGFAVTGAMMGALCVDVLRVMHNEPETMFKTLKQRVEEMEDGMGMELIDEVAWSFNNMPYLVMGDEYRENGKVEEDEIYRGGEGMMRKGIQWDTVA